MDTHPKWKFSKIKAFFVVSIISILVMSIFGCHSRSKPNVKQVSKIPVKIKLLRFENDLYALDTNHLERALERLKNKYDRFYDQYVYNIALLPIQDSGIQDTLKKYLKATQPLYNIARKRFPNLDLVLEKLQPCLQLLKYYFPDYKPPDTIISYVGPIETSHNIKGKNYISIGLQMYLGKQNPIYQTAYLQNLYPAGNNLRFDENLICPDILLQYVEEICPLKMSNHTLLETMLEQGRQLYILKQIDPKIPDSLLFQYTQASVDWCYANQKHIISDLRQKSLLESNRAEIILAYTSNELPWEDKLNKLQPSNIGKFLGYQMIKTYMDQNPKQTLQELAETIPKIYQ